MTTSLDRGRFWRDLPAVRPKVIADLRERVLPLFRAAWESVLVRHGVGDRTLIVGDRDLQPCAALLAELAAWRKRSGLREWTEAFALEKLEQMALFGADAPHVVFFQRAKLKKPATDDDLYAQGEQLAADAAGSAAETVRDQFFAEKYRRDGRARKAKKDAAEKATHERRVHAGKVRATERWSARPNVWKDWQDRADQHWHENFDLSKYAVARLVAQETGDPWPTVEKHITKPIKKPAKRRPLNSRR